MKHRAQTTVRSWPAPDPATRVVLDASGNSPQPPGTSSPVSESRTHRGELVVAAGLGGILVSVGSAFVKLIDLPSMSEVAIAVLGGALVIVGVVSSRRPATGRRFEPVEPVATVEPMPTVEALPTVEPQPVPVAMPKAQRRPVVVDLPSLTGQISEVLGELRHEYGMAYRTRTWIEEMLPAFGAELDDPALARSLLAVAALDAGGIRADVSGLSAVHSTEQIIATGKVVLDALLQVREACDGSGDRPVVVVRPSDRSRWPALTS